MKFKRIIKNRVEYRFDPFGKNHAIGTISQAHFLDLDEFTVKVLYK